jgi:hypothetical protein
MSWLDSNALMSRLPDNIGNARMFDSIALAENSLTGTVPEGLRSLARLQRLDLEGTDFVGRLPSFEANKSIRLLGVSLSTGTIPRPIRNCTSLQQIRVSNSRLSGSIPRPKLG